MNVVHEKFNNFKNFLQVLLSSDNEFVTKLKDATWEQFSYIMTPYIGQDESKLLDEICIKAKIKKEDYSKENIDRFLKYMQYFAEVIQALKQ